ncbi:hypothetical protein EOC94_26610 [Mesorhizobium sp. M6A.T.Ce.TU.016.01.1.1]|nr:hypothetical protein EOC94_26610 [Mesorhizobium sp. M6A.T.Ce.TU.016.01.1.1]RWP49209.1 MAG: hypothetical protein EOR05_11495 [Mesorhizobium sp.]
MHSVAPPSVLPDISPSSGEIEPSSRLSLTISVARPAPAWKLPISPLEGEMSGRTEGGPARQPDRSIASVPPP